MTTPTESVFNTWLAVTPHAPYTDTSQTRTSVCLFFEMEIKMKSQCKYSDRTM